MLESGNLGVDLIELLLERLFLILEFGELLLMGFGNRFDFFKTPQLKMLFEGESNQVHIFLYFFGIINNYCRVSEPA